MSTSARWPTREPPLFPAENLKRSLLELRREGWLSFGVKGDQAAVTYGPNMRAVAERWAIALIEGLREPPAPYSSGE